MVLGLRAATVALGLRAPAVALGLGTAAVALGLAAATERMALEVLVFDLGLVSALVLVLRHCVPPRFDRCLEWPVHPPDARVG